MGVRVELVCILRTCMCVCVCVCVCTYDVVGVCILMMLMYVCVCAGCTTPYLSSVVFTVRNALGVAWLRHRCGVPGRRERII